MLINLQYNELSLSSLRKLNYNRRKKKLGFRFVCIQISTERKWKIVSAVSHGKQRHSNSRFNVEWLEKEFHDAISPCDACNTIAISCDRFPPAPNRQWWFCSSFFCIDDLHCTANYVYCQLFLTFSSFPMTMSYIEIKSIHFVAFSRLGSEDNWSTHLFTRLIVFKVWNGLTVDRDLSSAWNSKCDIAACSFSQTFCWNNWNLWWLRYNRVMTAGIKMHLFTVNSDKASSILSDLRLWNF